MGWYTEWVESKYEEQEHLKIIEAQIQSVHARIQELEAAGCWGLAKVFREMLEIYKIENKVA